MKKAVERVPFAEPSQYRTKYVAAYARVSSGKDAMLHSLAAQVSYYSEKIQHHSGWEYCGVYADEAITGTKDDRQNFQRLLADCRSGKIDLVITKSISRFARNTVTLLESVRELKSCGVDVFFEEQNIHSISADGELILTVLAAYAQEESLSVSENQKWRVKKNFEDGKPWNCTMLGYRYDGEKLVVKEDEAETVRRIYREFISGKGRILIVKGLIDDGVPTRYEKEWCKRAVTRILSNYAYTGNLLLQKTFRENHITKKIVINEGQEPMYHVSGSHEPIISAEQYEQAQLEMARRAEKFTPPKQKENHIFTGLIVCGNCGKHFKYKPTKTGPVWICTTYNNLGKKHCPSKQIPEPALMTAAKEVLGSLDNIKDKITLIRAEENNTLVFVFSDGKVIVKQWKDRSRAESWTQEMKAEARRKYMERRSANG